MNRASYRQVASTLMIVTGLALVLVNMLGLALAVSVVDEHHEFANDSVPGYAYSVQDTSRLQGMLREPMTNFDLETVNNTIFESLIHSKRTIHIYENALLWLGGTLYEPLSRTQNPRRIVAGGGGLCSDVSTVLNSIARLNGFETRFVGLNGHVVSEIRTDSGWRVADPDYGITYPVGLEVLENDEGVPLMREQLRNRAYDDETIDWYVERFQSSEDNTVTEVDVALSPRLYAIEVTTEWLKWIIPIALMLLGVISSRKHITIASRRGT